MNLNPLIPSQIEKRKLTLLLVASRLIANNALHSGQPHDVENGVKFAVRVARQMLDEVDRSEPEQ